MSYFRKNFLIVSLLVLLAIGVAIFAGIEKKPSRKSAQESPTSLASTSPESAQESPTSLASASPERAQESPTSLASTSPESAQESPTSLASASPERERERERERKDHLQTWRVLLLMRTTPKLVRIYA